MNKKIVIFVLLLTFIFLEKGYCPGPGDISVSMDFKEASLKDVLKVLSQQTGLNFVASHEIEDRKITLYFENVSVEDALNTILRANNLTYEQPPGSNIIIIQELLIPEVETITRVYTLNYAKADSVKELFDKMREKREEVSPKEKEERTTRQPIKAAGLLTEYGKIVSDTRTNSLIITDIPAQFPVIEETLVKLDEVTPQVMIEAEILETRLGVLDKLGIEWSGTIAAYYGPRVRTHYPMRSRDLKGAGKVKAVGPDLATGEMGLREIAYGMLDLSGVSAILRALSQETETKILARPRVLTLNNETAKIDLTAKTAVGIKRTRIGAGEEVTEEAERMDTGILLKVTPQITKDNYIIMLLEPSVTSPVKSPFFNAVDPHIRSVHTTVRVKDGDTIVIGGLISTEESEAVKRVPFLGDIPLVGSLFKSSSKDKTDRELIVFITPHIFKDYISPLPFEELEREITVPPNLPKEKAIEATLDKFSK